jgi:hypothetical protein
MNTFKETILSINSGQFTKKQMVLILELVVSSVEIDTLSEMERKEPMSRNGIIKSPKYKKIYIGKQRFAIKGVCDDKLPF